MKKWNKQDWIDGKCAILWENEKKDKINTFLEEIINTSVGGVYKYYFMESDQWNCADKTNLPIVTIDELIDELIDEFKLPEKWCVKGIQNVGSGKLKNNKPDLFKAIRSIFPDTHTDIGFQDNWYYFKRGESLDYPMKIPKDYKVISFEQFEKYILKQENMEKKIIGYKIPTSLWEGQIPKGAIYVKCSHSPSNYTWKDDQDDSYNIPKEVVETWEPVYEELPKFKVGDYITVVKNEHKYLNGIPGETYKIIRISGNNLSYNPSCSISSTEVEVRLATQDEIDAVTQKVFYFGDVEFICKRGQPYAETKFGDVTLRELEEAIEYIENPPKLAGHAFCVHHVSGNKGFYLNKLDETLNIRIGFGCKFGKLSELKAIHKYIDENE